MCQSSNRMNALQGWPLGTGSRWAQLEKRRAWRIHEHLTKYSKVESMSIYPYEDASCFKVDCKLLKGGIVSSCGCVLHVGQWNSVPCLCPFEHYNYTNSKYKFGVRFITGITPLTYWSYTRVESGAQCLKNRVMKGTLLTHQNTQVLHTGFFPILFSFISIHFLLSKFIWNHFFKCFQNLRRELNYFSILLKQSIPGGPGVDE